MLCSLVLFSLHHLFKRRYSRDGVPHQIQQQTVFRQMHHLSALKVKRSSVVFIRIRLLLGYAAGSRLCTLESEHFQFKQYCCTGKFGVTKLYKCPSVVNKASYFFSCKDTMGLATRLQSVTAHNNVRGVCMPPPAICDFGAVFT